MVSDYSPLNNIINFNKSLNDIVLLKVFYD